MAQMRYRSPIRGKCVLPMISICHRSFGSLASKRWILLTGGRDIRLRRWRASTSRTVSLWTGNWSLSLINLAERCLPSNLQRTIPRSSLSVNFLWFDFLLSLRLSGPLSNNFFRYRQMLRIEHANFWAASCISILLFIKRKMMFFLTHIYLQPSYDLLSIQFYCNLGDHMLWQFRFGKTVTT